MFSIEAYIKQVISKPKYSITKWITAASTGGNTFVATIDETANTPKLIFVNQLYLNFTTTAGGFTLTDTVGNVIFNMPTSSQVGILNPFAMFHLFKSTKVTFTSVGSVVGFSICYQYVYE